jgi:hypothetical protein
MDAPSVPLNVLTMRTDGCPFIPRAWVCICQAGIQHVIFCKGKLGGADKVDPSYIASNRLFQLAGVEVRFNDNNDKLAYAGQLNSFTRPRALLVLHDRGIFCPGN